MLARVAMHLTQLPSELRAAILEECFINGTFLAWREIYVNEQFRCRQVSKETSAALREYAKIRRISHQLRSDADDVFFRHYKICHTVGALAPLEKRWRSDTANFVLSKLRHLSLEMLVGNATQIVLRLELHRYNDVWTCDWKTDVYNDLGKDDRVSERRMIRAGLPFVESQLSLMEEGDGLWYEDVEAIRQIMANQCTVELPKTVETSSWPFDNITVVTSPRDTADKDLQSAPEDFDNDEVEVEAPVLEDYELEMQPRKISRVPTFRHTINHEEYAVVQVVEVHGQMYKVPKDVPREFYNDLVLLAEDDLVAKYGLRVAKTNWVKKTRRRITQRLQSLSQAIVKP